jgi:GNAT superfamily N-acetyltransferase
MSTEALKIEVAQQILSLSDESLLEKINELLNNETIVGFALYYVRYSTWKGCRLYLEDFIVTDSHRGKGIGKQLFDTIVLEAHEKGFNGMTWQVLDWNEPALNFYKKYEAGVEAGWLNGSLSKQQLASYYEK